MNLSTESRYLHLFTTDSISIMHSINFLYLGWSWFNFQFIHWIATRNRHLNTSMSWDHLRLPRRKRPWQHRGPSNFGTVTTVNICKCLYKDTGYILCIHVYWWKGTQAQILYKLIVHKSKFDRMKWAIPTSSVDAMIAASGTILSALVKPMSWTVQNCKQPRVAPKRNTEK